ncbi:MAG: helix-turn-helix domain-containing protein [Planctomycetota bacterium]
MFDPSYPVEASCFARQVRKARMDAGLQVKQLAQAVAVHEMTIIDWEQGRTRPRRKKMEEIKTVLQRLSCVNVAESSSNGT